jgi:hypothetical protein
MRPDLARVGDKIQIIRNDRKQRFSLSEDTIDHVDRNVEDSWGELDEPEATDFNSHCIQTTLTNSRSSSGSLVVNIARFVVALVVSGSTDGNTNFCLLLERPCYALEFIQKKLPVPRRDIQCQWSFQSFSECEKLGLSHNWCHRLQRTETIGMLVAKTIILCRPSNKIIQVGDILLEVDRETVTRFTLYKKILDRKVEHRIQL